MSDLTSCLKFISIIALTWWSVALISAQDQVFPSVETPEDVDVLKLQRTGEFLGKSKTTIEKFGLIRSKTGITSPLSREKVPDKVFSQVLGTTSHYKFRLEFTSESGNKANAQGEVIRLTQTTEDKTNYFLGEITGVEGSTIGTYNEMRYYLVVITTTLAPDVKWELEYRMNWSDNTLNHGCLTDGDRTFTITPAWHKSTPTLSENVNHITFLDNQDWWAAVDKDGITWVFRPDIDIALKTVLCLAIESIGQ